MKRFLLAALALTPLLQVPLFAQSESLPEKKLKEQIQMLERELHASDFASETLRREMAVLMDQNQVQQQDFQARMMVAIEAELKATLERDAILKRMEEMEVEFAKARQDIEAHMAAAENEKRSLEEEVSQLQNRLSSADPDRKHLEADLRTSIYVAKNVGGKLLAELAGQAFGERVAYTSENSNFQTFASEQRRRFTAYSSGSQVLVTDFPDQLEKALDLLTKIDDSFSEAKIKELPRNEPTVVIYKPKALDPYQVIELIHQCSWANNTIPNTVEVPGTGSVRIEGSSASVKKALAALEANDQFPPQVRIRAWLIHTEVTAHTADNPNRTEIALPKKLLSGLQGALPGQEFHGLASMFIQSSVGNGQSVRAMTQPSSNADFAMGEWTLTANMKTYDSSEGLLSLQQCSFNLAIGQSVERLSADLLLRKDEYTVIGSIRGGSMYLVLSFEEI